MLKYYASLVLSFFFLSILSAQTTAIPDAFFEQALINLGIDTDGTINQSVANADISDVTVLNVKYKSITDLTGIEGFVSLTDLDCSSNQLTKLDLTKNTALKTLNWSYSYVLTSLDLSKNINLESIDVSNTNLTSLNLSTLTNLKSFTAFNSKLTSLDVSNNLALDVLRCALNQITNLDLSNNTALTTLDVRSNQLTSLDVSQNSALISLMCNNNDYTSVNVRNGNNANMAYVDFRNSPSLTCIQVDNEYNANKGLGTYSTWKKDVIATYMEDCSRVTYVPDDNFEQALIDLGVDNDGIVNDTVETVGIYNLTTLNIENKNITDLTGIEDFAFLETLNCSNNQISTLNISTNLSLKELNCNSNQLTNLDVSQNTALEQLYCNYNLLTNLVVNQNSALTKLDCSHNSIVDLNLNLNSAITETNCSYNQLTRLDVYNGNNTIITVFNAINNPNLQCINVDNETNANNGIAPYNSWRKDDTANYSEGCLGAEYTFIPDNNFEQALIDLSIDTDGIINNSVATADISGVVTLDVSSKGISNLKGIEDFISLTTLKCNSNPITTIDLSQNTALMYLYCFYTNLTSLDLSNNTALIQLRCYHTNYLTSLDLSNNTALKVLDCYAGQLTGLDLSNNTALTYLNCYYNKLTYLNVKNGNNSMLGTFVATANPNLTCIQVDNEADANNGLAPYDKWSVDATVTFSEDCSFSGTTYVPDDNFEQALIDLGIDTDGTINDAVAVADIYQITSLDIVDKNITDLTGIEGFINLEVLHCQSNQLSNLDLSKNSSLTELNCSNNLLISLNVKNNNNDLLMTFNATNNSNLQCIKVDNEADANNGIAPYNFWQKDTTANYSEGCLSPGYTYIPDNNFEQALIDLGIDTDGIINNSVATADISGIVSLDVSSKSISNLKGIEDFISLTTLSCQINTIKNLDLSQNVDLTYLDCHNNQLTSLNISQNTALTELNCRTNLLTSLNVSNNAQLFKLTCSQNKLTSLNVSNNTALLGLFCYSNQLTNLDVSHNALLEGLYCDQNQISNINLNGANALDLLICGSNQLTNLDVSQNIALTRLDCYNNNLQYLDMSQNTALHNLDCARNQLTFLDVKNGKNNLLTVFNATNNPALQCIQVDNAVAANAGESSYTNWNKDASASFSENCNTTIITDSNFEQALIDLGLISDNTVDGYVDTSEISTITTLDISSKNISDLTGIEAFTSLTTLIVSNNQLTYLDLSYNTNLMYLDASNNPLTTLILTSNDSGKIADKTVYKTVFTSNTNLTYIDISLANLVTIDISNIPNLQSFYAQGNNLIALDVSNNSNLTTLDITNNPLTCAQVSQVQLDNIPTGWNKDSTTNYSTDCAALNLDEKELGLLVKMYPNPVNDLLHIDTEIALVKVELYSMLGQKIIVVKSSFNTIPTNHLSKGMYIVKLYSEAGTVTKKLIKE